MKRLALAFVLACVSGFVVGCGDAAPDEDVRVLPTSLEGDFAYADGSVIRFSPDGRVGVYSAGRTLALGRFEVVSGLLKLDLFDLVSQTWLDALVSFVINEGLCHLNPLFRKGPCGHLTGDYYRRSTTITMDVWGARSEAREDVQISLLDEFKARVSGDTTAQGTYDVGPSGELILNVHIAGLPRVMQILQPRFQGLSDPASALRPLTAAESATLPEPRGLGVARVSFNSLFPPAGWRGTSLAVTVRDDAGAAFVTIEAPYDPAAMANASRPMGLPVPEGAAVIETNVRLRDAGGAERCFGARAPVSLAHAEEKSLELTPEETACAP